MIKHILSISFYALVFAFAIASSHCGGDGSTSARKKGIVALVFSDLTKSINDETANRQKQNIEELFQNLPAESSFYLFSIDQGTNKPSIYEFSPKFTEIKNAEDEDKVKEELAKIKEIKETTEREKLRSSLDAYQSTIRTGRGHVSCISNKFNALADLVASKRLDSPEYEIRIYFYSDMIEDCQNSFDGKLLNFEKLADDTKEAAHLEDIQKRIEKNFEAASVDKNLKSIGTKIYVILTAQDDKQSLRTLKTIWNSFFAKLGLQPNDISWTNDNEKYFSTL